MADQTTIEIVGTTVTVLGTVPIGPRGLDGVGGGVGDVDVVSNVATSRILGRVTAGTGDSEELTAAQVRTLLNVEDGATANMSAAEILALLLTVDGAGSGLDADRLDGQSSAAFQPVDSDLTAIAALTTTAFGRALLELANAAAGRTALGLGTAATAATGDFDPAGAAAAAQAASQPVDSDLTAIAALTTTAYGRSLLEAANAAALRSLAGLVLGTDIYSKAAVDAGFQPLDADLTALAAAGNSAVLAATTASFLTADETKLDGIEAGAEVNDSAAEILAKLVTVDGAGSGLDADLLDGQSSAAFATAAALTAHIDDTADAHDASAISIADAGNDFTATDVEGALAELQADHEADATALSDHIADTSGAHAASAVSYAGNTGLSSTDVEAALDELDNEKVAKATFPVSETIALSDETTAITTGTEKVTWRAPYAFTLTAVRASLSTASSSGTPTVDINESGTTILSTKLTIDANEKTSTSAATPAVISDSAIADDAEITFDIDVAGTGAKGLKVTLIGTRAV